MINDNENEAKTEKKRSSRYDINRPRRKLGHKYAKYKICLDAMMVICIKQHLSNTWSLIHEKVKQNWGWFKKSVAYKKSVHIELSWIFRLSDSYYYAFFPDKCMAVEVLP